MSFPSILFAHRTDRTTHGHAVQPPIFGDLGLDQIISAVLTGKEEYGLAEFFYAPLTSADAIVYRQAAMQDIERPGMQARLHVFARRMREMRARLSQTDKRHNQIQRWRWFLDIVFQYCDMVRRLNGDLRHADIRSGAFASIRQHIMEYASSDRFTKLADEAQALTDRFSALRFNVLIDGLTVTVTPRGDEPDYGKAVKAAFANFTSRTSKLYPFDKDTAIDVDAIEAQILEKVAGFDPEPFNSLKAFFDAHQLFRDPVIDVFDREVQFYIAYIAYLVPLRKAGLQLCYPDLQDESKNEQVEKGFDIALAAKLLRDGALPVTNDFHLEGAERIIVVTGPNQGGKTTFAKTFGQLHYLGALGLPVAATVARLHVPDRIFTHFERTERMTSLRGKLQDDLVRIHDILTAATPSSIIIINEIFSSTSLEDALFLSRKIGDAIIGLDALCIWVTFIEEVASLSRTTVSMVGEVDPDNPERRTFKILRQPANGLAYAMSIARKYHLIRESIRERIPG